MKKSCFKKLPLPVKGALGVIAGSAGFIGVTAAAYLPFVIADASKNYNDKCDVLMILGSDVIGADTPSPQLMKRMERAADYLAENPGTIAIPCGGCFRPEQKKSEAAIVGDYLISRGISPDRIVLEDKSTTTVENFKFAKEIIAGLFPDRSPRVAFLTSSYHIHRSSIIAGICGFENIGKVTAPTPGEAYKRYIREYFVAYELPKRILEKKLTNK